MATNEIWSDCEAIVVDVAETRDLDYVNALIITNRSGADLYVKFGWDVGDTEVSHSNFDIVLGDGAVFSMTADAPTFPRVPNMRVISAASGYVSAIGW